MMDWVETFVRYTKGDMAGQPFYLGGMGKILYTPGYMDSFI